MIKLRRTALPAIVCAGVLALSSCGMPGSNLYDTPLPGGADLGSDPITLSADFDDVLDLVPQSDVKVDNVAVGRVDGVDLTENAQMAHVTMKVRHDIELPAGTTARLKQTSLLGEKYVALVRPEEPEAGSDLADGDRMGIADTSEAAQVEQVLGSLSLVLNGGDIGQFQEISRELQDIASDRPDKIKGFIKRMDGFVSGLDDRKGAITEALDNLGELSRTLDADKDKIANALDGLSPGMRVIADQREQLVSMLSALDRLSDVTVDTLNKAQDDIVADLKSLRHVLDQLAKAGSDLPKSLEILLTYPFPDSVLGAIEGDYFNVFIETNFRTTESISDCQADIGDDDTCLWPQPKNSTAADSGSKPESGPSTKSTEDPPTMLPPTSSPAPGMSEPSIPVPSSKPGTVPEHAPDKKPGDESDSGGDNSSSSPGSSSRSPAEGSD